MSRVIKIVLFSLIVLLLIIFYKIYLEEKNLIIQEINTTPSIQKETLKDNLIHKLTYSVNLGQNNEYIINSDLSEITYNNDSTEIVNMQGVSATIIDKNQFIGNNYIEVFFIKMINLCNLLYDFRIFFVIFCKI